MNDFRRISKDTSTRFHPELDKDRLEAEYDGLMPDEEYEVTPGKLLRQISVANTSTTSTSPSVISNAVRNLPNEVKSS